MKRLAAPALLLVAVYYAVFGGGYSVFDLSRIQSETTTAEARVSELREITASLTARAEALEHDPRTLERLARERFGMIREGEILYRFAEGPERGGTEVDSGDPPR